MTSTPNDLVEAARVTARCLSGVRVLARDFGQLPIPEIEAALHAAIEEAEPVPVTRILHLTAFVQKTIDPRLLCDALGLSEDMIDTAPCFALQDAQAIPALVEKAQDETLPFERQLFAAQVATELTLRFGRDPQPVCTLLRKFKHGMFVPEIEALIDRSLSLLEVQDDQGTAAPPSHWLALRVAELLPERPPPHVVGGDYTVRRPVPKLGRNDPCHCGSGRKYKKCCYTKDQELLRDASAHAGITRSELKAQPGLVDDPSLLRKMPAHELRKLDPSSLGEQQLYAGYQRALDFKLHGLAFDMLLELERRPGVGDFDPHHFEDLLSYAIDAQNRDLVDKIKTHCAGQEWMDSEDMAFHLSVLDHPEWFEALERECRKGLDPDPGERTDPEIPLIRTVYGLASHYPALAVVLARAAIASAPDRRLDGLLLLDVIQEARLELGLEPEDPAEILFDWLEDRDQQDNRRRTDSRAMESLAKDLNATRAALDENKEALRKREERLAALAAELEKARSKEAPPQGSAHPPEEPEADPAREAKLCHLREQVRDLKAKITDQQVERRRLRRLLADEHNRVENLSHPEPVPEPPPPAEDVSPMEPSGQPILPEYSDAFRKRLTSLPPALAAKAILAAGRFAAHEAAIWRQTRSLERLPGHYRIRIGLDHRLLVRWRPGRDLEILDLIPRQELEAWIRRRG